MAITRAMVRSYADTYSVEQITTWRSAAMTALAQQVPRVELTGANFKEGGSQGQFVAGEPGWLIELFTAVLDYKAAETAAETQANRNMLTGDFSCRPIGW